MATKDDFRSVARQVKQELDDRKMAFKTYQREQFTSMLKKVTGDGAHKGGESVWGELETAFGNEGILAFPPLDKTAADGFVRLYRSGTRIAAILNAIRFPGGGSDDELSTLLGKLKPPRYESQPPAES
jgi:hypothetical protein